MRRVNGQRRRTDLAWYLAGVVVVQLALAVGVDRCWLQVRDPDYFDLESIIRERSAAAPGHPLVLALGSSRTQMALAAQQLNHAEEPNAPVVVNAAMSGGGPMLTHIVLRRLLRAGVRPDLVFVEIIPCALSIREGAPLEERQRFQARHTLSEVARLWHYYGEKYRLCSPWLQARLLPSYRYQAELRTALGLDLAPGHPVRASFRDAYGWLPCPKTYPPEAIAYRTKDNLDHYAIPLTEPKLSPGAVDSLRDTLFLCIDRHIPVVLVVPAESSVFRTYAPAVQESQLSAIRRLAAELAVPVVDCRDWVDDAGFWDGHHVTLSGATQFTERFDREVLQPWLARTQSAAAAPTRRP